MRATIRVRGADGRFKRAQTVRGELVDPDFGPQAKRCRERPCCVCSAMRKAQPNPTEAHHEPPLSHGGTDRDTVPLCGSHHRQRHRMNAARFWALHELKLEAVKADARNALPPAPGDHGAIPI